MRRHDQTLYLLDKPKVSYNNNYSLYVCEPLYKKVHIFYLHVQKTFFRDTHTHKN